MRWRFLEGAEDEGGEEVFVNVCPPSYSISVGRRRGGGALCALRLLCGGGWWLVDCDWWMESNEAVIASHSTAITVTVIFDHNKTFLIITQPSSPYWLLAGVCIFNFCICPAIS